MNVAPKKKYKIGECVEILSDDVMQHSNCDEFQDTLKLDATKALDESERENCSNFTKKELKRKLSRVEKDEFEGKPAWDVVLAGSKNNVEIKNRTNFAKRHSKIKLSEPSS